MKNILFVCTGNTCRSPMAQALFQKQLQGKTVPLDPDEFRIISAGIHAHNGMGASREAIEVMNEEGIDISPHRSLCLGKNLVSEATLVLTMTESHYNYLIDRFPDKADYIYTLANFVDDKNGDVLDPYGMGLEAYRQSRMQLKDLIGKVIIKLSTTCLD